MNIDLTDAEKNILWNFIDDNFKVWSSNSEERELLIRLMNDLAGIKNE